MTSADKNKRKPGRSRSGATALEPGSNHFARRLKQLRAARGWSLDALASASGVSRSMLSQVERNQANPTLAVAFRISHPFAAASRERCRVL